MVRWIRLLAVAGVLVGGLIWWTTASAAPTDGNWKITLGESTRLIHLALVKIATKDGKPDVEMTAPGVPILKEGKVVDPKTDKGTLTFTLSAGPRAFRVVVQIPEGEKAPKFLKGVVLIGDKAIGPAVLTRTKEKQIDKFLQEPDELKTLQRAEPADLAKRYKELEEAFPNSPILLAGTRAIFAAQLKAKASDADLKHAVEQLRKMADSFGPALEESTDLEVAKALASKGRLGEIALPIALAAEKKLPADATVGQTLPVSELVIAALRAAGKTDEAKKRQADLDKINAHLDEEFEKEAINFKVEPFAGRKGKSNRVALVELFTGAECPPCVAADIAFDACLKAFKPSDAIFLEDHLHIPRPDALTSPASVTRQEYYGDVIAGTPTFIINGGEGPGLGGGRAAGAQAFKGLSAAIETALKEEATAKLALDVKRTGDKITIEAKASDVAKPGDKVKLRLVLIEEVVRYAGGNRQRLHHHVVRDLPGGADGLAVKEKTATQKVLVNLADVREKLTKYLAEYEEEHGFPTTARPLDLKKLKVVAFLQDDGSKEVLQAIQADVP